MHFCCFLIILENSFNESRIDATADNYLKKIYSRNKSQIPITEIRLQKSCYYPRQKKVGLEPAIGWKTNTWSAVKFNEICDPD